METRLKNYIHSIAFKDYDGKVYVPPQNQTFIVSKNDHLTSLPITGNVDVECPATDDTITIDYRLLEVTQMDESTIKVIYKIS